MYSWHDVTHRTPKTQLCSEPFIPKSQSRGSSVSSDSPERPHPEPAFKCRQTVTSFRQEAFKPEHRSSWPNRGPPSEESHDGCASSEKTRRPCSPKPLRWGELCRVWPHLHKHLRPLSPLPAACKRRSVDGASGTSPGMSRTGEKHGIVGFTAPELGRLFQSACALSILLQ